MAFILPIQSILPLLASAGNLPSAPREAARHARGFGERQDTMLLTDRD